MYSKKTIHYRSAVIEVAKLLLGPFYSLHILSIFLSNLITPVVQIVKRNILHTFGHLYEKHCRLFRNTTSQEVTRRIGQYISPFKNAYI